MVSGCGGGQTGKQSVTEKLGLEVAIRGTRYSQADGERQAWTEKKEEGTGLLPWGIVTTAMQIDHGR